MAEGGGYFGYEDPDLDYDIDHDDDDDDDDDDDEQEVNTTRPFQPGAASTPYHGGEQFQMHTMQHKQSGLPDTSYAETPLLGDFFNPEEKQSRLDWAIDFTKNRFPKADLQKLGAIGFSKKGAQADIVSHGPKGGETPIFRKRWQRVSKKLHRQIFNIPWAKCGTNFSRPRYFTRAAAKG